MARPDRKIIVGSEEWCSLPALGVPAIKCRVDSGARTSSLHAYNIRGFERSGEQWVSFEIHPLQKDRKLSVACEAPVVDRRMVKSSSGDAEQRFVIATRVHLGDHDWEIEITLTNRDSMGYRMLLGREAMRDRILVDPAESFCLGRMDEEKVRGQYTGAQHSPEGLSIAVLASNPDLYSNQRLIEAGEQRGHRMHFLNIAHCTMKLDAAHPEVHTRGGQVLEGLDAIIPRIRPDLTIYGCALVRQFQTMGVYSLNGAGAIAQARDRLFALQMLLGSNVAIPVTAFAKSPRDTGDLVRMAGGAPVVVKLLEGPQGKGAVLAESTDAASSVISAFRSLDADILVQRYVQESGGRSVRCLVVNRRVIASVEHKSPPGEFRAGLSPARRAGKVKITKDERQIAVQATKALGLTVAGVDLVRAEGGPLVLEVNASPGLENVESLTGRDVAGAMIRVIERKIGWKAEA